MRIGILGAGPIGSSLARRLSSRGHEVAIANSRGPETISPEALSTGVRAVAASEVAAGVEVLIVSVPMNRNADIAEHVRGAPDGAVVIDMSAPRTGGCRHNQLHRLQDPPPPRPYPTRSR